MATITVTPGHIYGPSDTVTSTNLNDLGDPAVALDAGTIVNADISASADIGISKLEDVADMKVIGNTSGSAAAPQEVSVLDEDDMSSDSATAVATQQSIKAYVDTTAEGSSNFTTEDSASAGYQVFASGLKMAWGEVDNSGEVVTNFPTGVNFTVAPTVQATYNGATTSTVYYGVTIGSVTTSGFTHKGSYTNQYKPRYLAIGH